MRNKKFTIEDIEECLKELDFEWVDRYVFNSKKNQYEYAKLSHFTGKPAFLYLKRKHYILTMVLITNEEFIISRNSTRLDASLLWKDKLEEKQMVEMNLIKELN